MSILCLASSSGCITNMSINCPEHACRPSMGTSNYGTMESPSVSLVVRLSCGCRANNACEAGADPCFPTKSLLSRVFNPKCVPLPLSSKGPLWWFAR